ncbi:TfoX/Sxy family DNA transformation protein [Thalassotalea ponticola]|uniref:TfoX/Sxy family DNA transformation protein n=1 Tax=Thalassotalea ponticola TaxID=1523392 RepID=UPI0025B60BDD|nr:TfoX/Sxy family DNA transformation protein [Thalassotalea ponticola]MDN3651478.1 TfoX/Sxy family DNA transformation protein [Thalassotalea ponticola]
MGEIANLKGLGPKSEKCLNDIGIKTRSDLESIGPVKAFVKLRNECYVKPSLNFLYAMVGAIEGKHWTKIAQSEKGRLLLELDGYQELEKLLKAELIDSKT